MIDPAVISRTGKDKFFTNTVVQEQVSSHDGTADGKNVVIHYTLSLQRTGTVKCLAVQTLCLFSGFCLQSQHLNNTANRKLEVDFKCFYCCFPLKLPYIGVSEHVCSLFFPCSLYFVPASYRCMNIPLFLWKYSVWCFFLCISGMFTLRLHFFQCCQVISVHFFPLVGQGLHIQAFLLQKSAQIVAFIALPAFISCCGLPRQ